MAGDNARHLHQVTLVAGFQDGSLVAQEAGSVQHFEAGLHLLRVAGKAVASNPRHRVVVVPHRRPSFLCRGVCLGVVSARHRAARRADGRA